MFTLRYFFKLACFATAFAMTVLWLHKYSLDEDIVQFDIKSFDLKEEEYPMLSFCLIDEFIFIESKLKNYHETLTAKEYMDILSGMKSYIKEKKINFDDVTFDLADFLLHVDILFKNGSFAPTMHPDSYQDILKLTYSGFAIKHFIKCFGFQPKFTNIFQLVLTFNASVYPDGIRPSSGLSTGVALHLPNQISLAGNYFKYTWPKRNDKKRYSMEVKLQQIDLFRRRSKRNDPCTDTLNFDQTILDEHLQNIGCKAPYQKTNKSLETCDSKKKMLDAKFDPFLDEIPKKACTSASALSFSYDEPDWRGTDSFDVVLYYPNQYRQIKMIQAIDLHTLIGNAGAYIGLFLGKNLGLIKIGDNIL